MRSLTALVLCAGVLSSALSFAGEPSSADRETARALLIEGRMRFEEKKYEDALKAFKAAHSIMGVPTTGLDLAKAQEALGMLVEARTTALEVMLMPPKPNEPEAFVKARLATEDIAERLAARIPSLVIEVKGPPRTGALRVTVDQEDVPTAVLTLPRKVNPGPHTLEASAAGYTSVRRSVTLQEGETVAVMLELIPVAPPPKKDATARSHGTRSDEGRSVPTWSWVALGAGVASLGVSVGFGIDFANVKQTIAVDCPKNQCDRARYTLDEANALESRWNRSLSLAITLGGLGLAGVGASLLGFMAESKETKTSVTPWVEPSGGGAVVRALF